MVDSLDYLQKNLFVRFFANLKEFRIVALKKTCKSTTVLLLFYKTITFWFPF